MNLRDELLAVREEHGVLSPRTVLEAARDKSHPLHARFEWDDTVAAEKYRLAQARELISVVTVPVPGKPLERMRAFHAIPSDEGADRYVFDPTEEIALDPLKRAIVLRDMERDWQAFKARYEHFGEFVRLIRREVEDAVA